MGISTKLILALALPVLGASTADAKFCANQSFDPSGFSFKGTRHSAFRGPRQQKIEEINSILEGRKNSRKADANKYKPATSISNVDHFADLDGPNDETWFYSANYTFKDEFVNEYFTDHIMLEYKFTIYNTNMDIVGTISDKVRYEDDEVRIAGNGSAGCQLTPVITKHFFNTDDKYEVLVGLSVNTKTPGLNHYRNLVYSLGGEKETLPVLDPESGKTVNKEFDKPINVIQSSIGDVLDASRNGVEEYYMTVYDESLPEDYEVPDGATVEEAGKLFWDALTKAKISIKMLGKADKDGNLKEIHEFSFPLLCTPGNQETSPFLMSFRKGNDVYFITQRYKEIFWNPYYSPEEDMTMRESNALVVNLYKIVDGGAQLVKTSEIPFVKDSDAEVLASFHSVGDLRYREDVNFGGFDFNKDNGMPAYYVTKDNYLVGEGNAYSFYVYDADGNKRKKVFEGAESTLSLSNVEGFEPQQLFVELMGSTYVFNMVDLISCKKVTSFPHMFDTGDPDNLESLTSNLDRVAYGDSYCYVDELNFAMLGEGEDGDDIDIMRFEWIDNKGQHMRTHEVNMGPNVQYSHGYISADVLNPKVYDSDDVYEYMLLTKRGLEDETSQEELIIGKVMCDEYPYGKTLLNLTPGEKGIIINVLPPYNSSNILGITWKNNDKYTQDMYFLPFDSPNSAVEEIEASGDASFSFDGSSLHAAGEQIMVYNLQGICVASGFEVVSTTSLSNGLYIATAGDKARKFIKK